MTNPRTASMTLGFLVSPSFTSRKGGADTNIDLSVFTTRKQRKPTIDANQPLITDYYDVIINDIEKLSKENKKLSDMLQQYLNITGNSLCGLSPILKSLIKNAGKNAYAYPTQRRHSEIMTKFATAFFIFCGPFAYEFLHKNLQQALPSTRSIQ